MKERNSCAATFALETRVRVSGPSGSCTCIPALALADDLHAALLQITQPSRSRGVSIGTGQVHRCLGYELERDPEMPDTTRRSDFLARRERGQRFLLGGYCRQLLR
jgi:hypothetical protein